MALQSITVTFPAHIHRENVVAIIEGNMNKNSTYECQCQFKEFDGEENVYLIWAEEKEAFYYIGMTASEIIRNYCS